MKRHAIYFAPALAGAAFTLHAAPLPAMPDPSLPVSHFITRLTRIRVSLTACLPLMPGGSR